MPFSDGSDAVIAFDGTTQIEPAESKIYRHPTFYEVPDEVGHM